MTIDEMETRLLVADVRLNRDRFSAIGLDFMDDVIGRGGIHDVVDDNIRPKRPVRARPRGRSRSLRPSPAQAAPGAQSESVRVGANARQG